MILASIGAFYAGMIVGGGLIAVLSISKQSDEAAEKAHGAHVTAGFERKLHEVKQSYPESGAHDLGCYCASCVGHVEEVTP